ncbi:MAG: hypothetical protein CL608_23025 [Anaerolineaceae bacterium]|nr:hypothetical protein [Anaerolineaceae bacterium]
MLLMKDFFESLIHQVEIVFNPDFLFLIAGTLSMEHARPRPTLRRSRANLQLFFRIIEFQRFV